MSLKIHVLEGFGLDFGGPEARFWRVRGSFFRDLRPLGRRNARTDFELRAKAAQFQLEDQLGRSSPFYVEVRPRSATSKSGRDLPQEWVGGGVPPGGFRLIASVQFVRLLVHSSAPLLARY